jgi:hypothetical protein
MQDSCQIRKLGLVNIGMVMQSAEKVILLLNCNQNILDLDISYNELTPVVMFKLAEQLGTNKNLQYLNISWNNFKELQTIHDPEQGSRMDPIHEMTIAKNLSNFIKYN